MFWCFSEASQLKVSHLDLRTVWMNLLLYYFITSPHINRTHYSGAECWAATVLTSRRKTVNLLHWCWSPGTVNFGPCSRIPAASLIVGGALKLQSFPVAEYLLKAFVQQVGLRKGSVFCYSALQSTIARHSLRFFRGRELLWKNPNTTFLMYIYTYM